RSLWCRYPGAGGSNMKPALQLRTSQHLALTPQLQQAIRLLQLSTQELESEIEQALQDNPMLEREEREELPEFTALQDAVRLQRMDRVRHGDADLDDESMQQPAEDLTLADHLLHQLRLT